MRDGDETLASKKSLGCNVTRLQYIKDQKEINIRYKLSFFNLTL